MYIDKEQEHIMLHTPTLFEIQTAGKMLCNYLKKPYNEFCIGVGTDYGTNVVIYYYEDEEHDD